MRGAGSGAASDHLPASGSNRSTDWVLAVHAQVTYSLGWLHPATTRTSPDGSSVAVCQRRASTSDATGVKTPVRSS